MTPQRATAVAAVHEHRPLSTNYDSPLFASEEEVSRSVDAPWGQPMAGAWIPLRRITHPPTLNSRATRPMRSPATRAAAGGPTSRRRVSTLTAHGEAHGRASRGATAAGPRVRGVAMRRLCLGHCGRMIPQRLLVPGLRPRTRRARLARLHPPVAGPQDRRDRLGRRVLLALRPSRGPTSPPRAGRAPDCALSAVPSTDVRSALNVRRGEAGPPPRRAAVTPV
jgi:hypothetical protein